MNFNSLLIVITFGATQSAMGLQLTQPLESSNANPRECAEFAGEWVGTCSEISNGEILLSANEFSTLWKGSAF